MNLEQPTPGGTLNAMKAQILTRALPYIMKYHGRIVVVKYGGNAMVSGELREAVMSDVILLSLVGIKVVLVHGGGPEISATLKRMGIESRFAGGLRVTDAETAQVVQMVLSGKTNKDLVALVQKMGGRALGLCGLDGGMLRVRKTESEVDLGFVGDVTHVDDRPIMDALTAGYIPIIATVGTDDAGQVYNINADTAAAAVAGALKAENLIVMTDVRGLMRDVADPESFISSLPVSEVAALRRQRIIDGGMIPKVECCVEAIRRGVAKAVMIDGRIPHAILLEMFSDEGIGTLFTR
ncbi:MAG: acetylglutamate kinase [Oscillospiraceae bacterium]|jgi:acetylglutamate kinase|nr:acetylglutamate kinase [Oscillospiraceae bacterium]